MNDEKSIRIIVQAVGVYSVAHAMYYFLESVARFITLRFFTDKTNLVTMETARPVTLQGVIYCLLLLIPAWIFLVKTDWCVRMVVNLSAPRREEQPEDESDE